MYKVIIAAIIGVFVCIFVFQQLDPNIQDSTSYQSQQVEQTNEDSISTTIEGEIALPGKYTISKTDTLETLIIKAGGLLESADKDAINLYLIIDTRDYIYIPSVSAYANDCSLTATVEKINVNTATATQLSTLSYISLSLGEKIVAYREENGNFECLEDLMKVSGIGKVTYERIRDYLTLK